MINKIKKIISRFLDLEFYYPKQRRLVFSYARKISALEYSNIPKFTIVIPIFNRLRETKRTLSNLKKYYHLDFEIILVNNNSDSDTARYINNLASKDNRIKVINLESNLGASHARTEGLKQVKTDYVAFLDNDIIIMPFYFENLFSTLLQNENVAGVQSRVVYPDLTIQINHPDYEIKNNFIIYKDTDEGKYFTNVSLESEICIWIPIGATLWRSEVIKKFEFDPDFGTSYEDNDLSLRITQSGYKVANCPKAICMHFPTRFAPDNSSVYNSVRFSNEQVMRSLRKFYEKHKLIYFFGSIEGHIKHLGYSNIPDYVKDVTSVKKR